MTIKLIAVAGIAVCITTTAMATSRAATTDETRAKIIASAQNIARFGGILEKPGSGKLALVLSQKSYTRDEIENLASLFGGQLQIPVSVVDSPVAVTLDGASGILSKTGVTVGIFIVDDEGLPLSLVAMEERWALINAAKVSKGAANSEQATKRLQREISRMLKAIFLNGTSEKGATAVRYAADLEKIQKDPIDGQQLFTIVRGLPSYGLIAPRIVPYKLACKEGWAPAPTNDIQKAIWSEVHATPNNPMKIEFDPKKGR